MAVRKEEEWWGMSKEALRLALEALEYIYEGANKQGPHTGISWRCVSKKAAPVITALREALAEQSAQRKPLTDEQIAKEVEAELAHYWNGEYIDTTGARDQLTAFARAIEAAHNIKEQP